MGAFSSSHSSVRPGRGRDALSLMGSVDVDAILLEVSEGCRFSFEELKSAYLGVFKLMNMDFVRNSDDDDSSIDCYKFQGIGVFSINNLRDIELRRRHGNSKG